MPAVGLEPTTFQAETARPLWSAEVSCAEQKSEYKWVKAYIGEVAAR
jgi:hypothetical protein